MATTTGGSKVGPDRPVRAMPRGGDDDGQQVGPDRPVRAMPRGGDDDGRPVAQSKPNKARSTQPIPDSPGCCLSQSPTSLSPQRERPGMYTLNLVSGKRLARHGANSDNLISLILDTPIGIFRLHDRRSLPKSISTGAG